MNFTLLDTEVKLLKRMSEDDGNSFEIIYNRYHIFIYRYVLNFVKSPELAEDLTQEVFIRIWELRKDLVNIKSLKAYLITTGRNHAINHLKKAANENNKKAEILFYYQNSNNSSDYRLLSSEYKEFIQTVLNSLPLQTRQVFKLCREQDKSYDEISNLLNISSNTVKKHIVRTHKLFKKKLDFLLVLFVYYFLL
jgi:RNA polymerase sigma-70 factor (ECF subfamily)